MPWRILTDTLKLYVPTGFDRYQKPTNTETYTISHIHCQADNITRYVNTQSSGMDTEVTLKGVVFIDARHSRPVPDIEALQEATQKLGGVMTCEIISASGSTSGPYNILTVDALPNDNGRLHHYEIGVA